MLVVLPVVANKFTAATHHPDTAIQLQYYSLHLKKDKPWFPYPMFDRSSYLKKLWKKLKRQVTHKVLIMFYHLTIINIRIIKKFHIRRTVKVGTSFSHIITPLTTKTSRSKDNKITQRPCMPSFADDYS
jgi:hypothetical protein